MERVRLAWHHFEFEVPATWEVIAHKKNPDDGQLVLSERQGQTMIIFWKRLPNPPDLRSRLVDWAAAQPGANTPPAHIPRCPMSRAGWEILVSADAASPAFAVRHLSGSGVLLSVVFPPHPAPERERLAIEVLESFRPNDGPEHLWAAFGVECSLPADWRLTSARALPAWQTLGFTNPHGDTVDVHRYGMLAILLADDDMATFYARQHGGRVQLRRVGEFRRQGKYPGVELGYWRRTSLLGRRREGRVWLWRCDPIQRLFAVDHCASPDRLRTDLVERVSCR